MYRFAKLLLVLGLILTLVALLGIAAIRVQQSVGEHTELRLALGTPTAAVVQDTRTPVTAQSILNKITTREGLENVLLQAGWRRMRVTPESFEVEYLGAYLTITYKNDVPVKAVQKFHMRDSDDSDYVEMQAHTTLVLWYAVMPEVRQSEIDKAFNAANIEKLHAEPLHGGSVIMDSSNLETITFTVNKES